MHKIPNKGFLADFLVVSLEFTHIFFFYLSYLMLVNIFIKI